MNNPEKSADSYPPDVSLVITGRDLDPHQIDDQLRLVATRSFRRGDPKPGGDTRWPHGFWILSSSQQLEAVNPVAHLAWLLDQLEPRRTRLAEFLRNHAVSARLSCFWVMPSSHEAITLESSVLSQLAALGLPIEFDIHSSDSA